MALTFNEFETDAAPAKASALTFDEFAPKSANAGAISNIYAGALKGAADLGATIMQPADALVNALGIPTAYTNAQRRAAMAQTFSDVADPESLSFKTGDVAANVAGSLGAGGALAQGVRRVAPALTKLPAALESSGATVGRPAASFGEKVGNAAIRTGAGATVGAGSAAMFDPASTEAGAAIGAALPVVGRVASLGAKGMGWLYDALKGNLGAIKAGQIGRDVAGPELAAIQSANTAADPGLTAGQAAAGIDRDTWQALAKMAEKNDPDSFYRLLADKQEAARLATLQGVTPDLVQAQGARTAADLVNYPAAEAVTFRADPALMKMAGNPYFKKAQAAIADLAEAQGVDFKTNPTGYLNAIKFGFDKILSSTGDSALSGAEKRVVYDLKNNLMSWMEKKNPLYAQARQQHAELSAPVNQAQVLEEMQATLQRGGGGERVTPFLEAMGRGENALLKRADQSPRFGGVEDVLTPEQLAARGKVAQELIRDRTLAERATAGEGGLRGIVGADTGLPRLPGFLSVVASATNKAISSLESKIGRETLAAVVKGMQSGSSANEMLAMTPAAERNAVMMWIVRGGPQRYLTPATASQAGQ